MFRQEVERRLEVEAPVPLLRFTGGACELTWDDDERPGLFGFREFPPRAVSGRRESGFEIFPETLRRERTSRQEDDILLVNFAWWISQRAVSGRTAVQ